MAPSTKDKLHAAVRKQVVGSVSSSEQDAVFTSFLVDAISKGGEKKILSKVEQVMKNKTIKAILKKHSEKAAKVQARSAKRRADAFVARKLAQVSLKKANNISSAMQIDVNIAGETFSAPDCKSTRYGEEKARKEISSSKYFPEVNAFPPDIIPKEHAYIKIRDYLKMLVYLVNTTPELRKHHHSFFNVTRNSIDPRHFKIAIFFDGFPLFSTTKQGACIVCIKVLNLVGLLQMAKYQWVQSFIVDKEQGTCTWKALVEVDEDILAISKEGIDIEFPEKPENCDFDWTFPGTTDSLTGVWKFTF